MHYFARVILSPAVPVLHARRTICARKKVSRLTNFASRFSLFCLAQNTERAIFCTAILSLSFPCFACGRAICTRKNVSRLTNFARQISLFRISQNIERAIFCTAIFRCLFLFRHSWCVQYFARAVITPTAPAPLAGRAIFCTGGYCVGSLSLRLQGGQYVQEKTSAG